MALVTITNLTNEVVLLQELYRNAQPNEVFTIVRERDELHAMPALQQLWKDGIIEVDVVSDPAEDDFIDQKLHLFNGTPLTDVTGTYHEPTITAEAGTNAPGQAPNLTVIGSLLVAQFTLNTDAAYRVFKIPSSFVGDPAFHVHWTKEEGVGGNGDESGNAVRWKISYTVFPGSGNDVNVAPTVIEVEDIYDDAGTTTRLVYRTPNQAAVGFIANYYVGICVEAITPTGAALTAEPALVSVDLTFTQYINQ